MITETFNKSILTMKTQNNSTTRSASVGMLYLIVFFLFGVCYWIWWNTCASQEKTDNKITFVWEGLESDIPADGNQMLNLSTNENVIYLNPVDE